MEKRYRHTKAGEIQYILLQSGKCILTTVSRKQAANFLAGYPVTATGTDPTVYGVFIFKRRLNLCTADLSEL